MLQINSDIYIKSIDESMLLLFYIPVWRKMINVYIFYIFFVYLMSDFPLCALYYKHDKHLRRY